MNTYYRSLLFVSCIFVLSTCGGGRTKSNNQTDNSNDSQGADQESPANTITSASLVKALQEISTTDGKLSLNVAFGSGAFHSANDPDTIFYTVSDRGPVISCNDSKAFFGKKDLCTSENGKQGAKGKIFLIPDYTPTIYKISVDRSDPKKPIASILESIPLTDSNGINVTGITNPLKAATTEKAYTPEGTRIPFNASGLDPEAIVKLSDGSFWITDEYAPSLVHVASSGTIISRIVPPTIADDLSTSSYPVLIGLPNILRKRVLNRGIEALAVSPDETQLFLMMESPLGNPTESTFEKSRNIRILRYELDADGNLGNATGEFVYTLDKRKNFTVDNNKPVQSSILISDMASLSSRELLVVERTKDTTKIYKVKLTSATNILSTPFDDEISPSLEETKKLESINIEPVNKELIYNSILDTASNSLSGKIEGIAVLDSTHIMLINDNDFGITGETNQIQILTTKNSLF